MSDHADVVCGRINLLDNNKVILVQWKGDGWTVLGADVFLRSKEETEARP